MVDTAQPLLIIIPGPGMYKFPWNPVIFSISNHVFWVMAPHIDYGGTIQVPEPRAQIMGSDRPGLKLLFCHDQP